MWIPPAYSPIRLSGIVRGLVAPEGVRAILEERLTEWYRADRALATASGTHALQLAIRAALERGGGEGPVALPAFNCYDLATAAVWVGVPVVFYDIDPRTLAPETESLAGAVEDAKVLVVANLFGFPLDWDLIRRLAGSKGIPVVEDAAQGLGAGWKGEAAGTFGDLSVLSFGRGKGWTGGRGGAVMARNGFETALPASLPRNEGSPVSEAAKSLSVWLLARPLLYGIPARIPALGLGETHYRSPTEPTAITPFAAAMVLAGRERSLREVEVRRGKANDLRERLMSGDGEVSIPEPLPGGESGYLRFPVLSPGGGGVAERKGVGRSYPRALAELEVLAPLIQQHVLLPGASRLVEEMVTYPVHSRVG